MTNKNAANGQSDEGHIPDWMRASKVRMNHDWIVSIPMESMHHLNAIISVQEEAGSSINFIIH